MRQLLLPTLLVVARSSKNFVSFPESQLSFTTIRSDLYGFFYKVTSRWLMWSLKFFLFWGYFFTAKEDLVGTTLATAGLCSHSLFFPVTTALSPSSSTIAAKLSKYPWRNQNNSWAWGLASDGKKGWTGAETQLLGLPQTWPFLSMIWVISSGPLLSNWDENLPFYLNPFGAPLVSKVYLYPFGFVTGSEGKDKVKLMEPPKASNHSAWQEATVKPFLLLLQGSLSIDNYPSFVEMVVWTPSQALYWKAAPSEN